MSPTTAVREIRRSINLLAASTTLLFLVIAALGAYGWWTNHQAVVANHEAVTALCTLRSSQSDDIARLSRRVQPNRRFVRSHPNGALGFTQAQLRQSVKDSEHDLAVLRDRRKALSNLDC